LLIAGVISMAVSFHCIINILALNQDSQKKIFVELKRHLCDNDRDITLDDRSSLHYTRAAILEAFRYSSVATFGRVHRAVVDTKIGSVKIRKDTSVITNLWGLHHDETFWEHPYGFFPERFLDLTGKLIPADHPNRKRLLHFGAGPRMCVGESLVSARLFIWLANFARKYHVTITEQQRNHIPPDCRDHVMENGFVCCPLSKLIITKRRY
jgi:cytochrome P450